MDEHIYQDTLQMYAIQAITFQMISNAWAWQDQTMHEDQACYLVHDGVTLGEGGGDQPPT